MRKQKSLEFIFTLTICFMLTSCNYNEKRNKLEDKELKESITENHFPTKFIDSISNHYTLSRIQVENNTTISRDLFNAKNFRFVGDSVYPFSNNSSFILATLIYDDGNVCRNKFLLIFNRASGNNTDHKLIESDCDEDESSSTFAQMNFIKLSDSTFVTIEIDKNHEMDIAGEIKKMWTINKNGKISEINNLK